MKSFNPNAPRDITAEIGVSRNVVEVTRPSKGCWRVEVNGKPVNDWSDQQSAEADATRRGWRGNGKDQGRQSPMINEKSIVFVNERGLGEVMMSLGPTLKFAS